MPTQPVSQAKEQSATAWLTCADGQRVVLTPTFKIGRREQCALVIPSSTVSREHALIVQDSDSTWRISDLGSTNGTFLNGRKVVQSQVLRQDDRITFGMGTQVYVFNQIQDLAEAYMPQGGGDATVIATQFAKTWIVVADIVGSTRLIQNWGSERYRETLEAWAGQCRQLVESCGGAINKFIGDAFLAYWVAERSDPGYVAGALQSLFKLQEGGGLPFRILVNFDNVAFGGRMQAGEESLWGPSVNFIFKAERVASNLRTPVCFATGAASVLQNYFQLQVLGEYEVPSFNGKHKFFTVAK